MLLLLACSSPPPLGPSHGGAVQEVQGYTIESHLQQSGLRLWIYDPAEQLVDPATIRGTAFIDAAGSTQPARFEPDGEGLRAKAKLPPGEPARARLALVVGARTLEAEVRVDHIGGIGFREDSPAHGGEVAIVDGALRVEYAPAEDVHHFWFTDLQRRAVGGELTGTLVDGGTEVPLAWDAVKGHLSGEWAGAGSRTVELSFTLDGVDRSVRFAR